MHKIKSLLLCVMCAVFAMSLFSGCAIRKQVVYVQGAAEQGTFQNDYPASQRIKVDDRLSIIVNCKEPELASLFNIQFNSSATTAGGGGNFGQNYQYFWVNPDGDIRYPVIGMLHVEGMTRKELQEYLESYMRDNGYIQDPIVNVQFAGATITVMGEVGSPGQKSFVEDRVSILKVIAASGGVSMSGVHDKVRLFREDGHGGQMVTTINLLDKDLIESEYFYLQHGDLIYVEPTFNRVSGRIVPPLLSFGMSLLSLGFTITTFVRLFSK